jgi:hypothetical protein
MFDYVSNCTNLTSTSYEHVKGGAEGKTNFLYAFEFRRKPSAPPFILCQILFSLAKYLKK